MVVFVVWVVVSWIVVNWFGGLVWRRCVSFLFIRLLVLILLVIVLKSGVLMLIVIFKVRLCLYIG